ncbi:hypothetical protein M440DRAFT_1343721 [Trichoderma longibrachiatum ATCC 18648]|uniref:ATP-grasp domain-containing protein n=1 Tax=Trichoderma longibrachiatum ATCC 18648 TaxID=983965 RepID=A0A2T4BQM4_TRILO|nr:hypothetical protein M440DRAFT_1343721 [Trichoderma longibrachiatum ATCC 18648]
MFSFGRSRAAASALSAAKRATPSVRLPGAAQQRRALSIHEYLSADLLRKYGVGVPKGAVAKTAAEAKKVAQEIGTGDLVIKAQVLAGGRGKGTFDNGLKGGVRVIYSPHEAEMFAQQMIGHKLITKQTGAGGRLCSAVYICERKFARREFYLAILMDRASQGPVIVSSSQGGMDIETVAKEQPDAITTTYIDINKGVTDEIARDIATGLGFSEQCIEDAKDTIQKLYKIFVERDATQIEINPLSETDPKVSAIFVNIFGGIVRCDAIATGLIRTVEALNLKIPIIARLQGTNVELAHQIINESGLKIFSIDDLQSAAEKAVQLSKVVKMARDIDVGVEFTLGI